MDKRFDTANGTGPYYKLTTNSPSYKERKAFNLRCDAAAIEGSEELVKVEISKSLAWLIRDMIGIWKLSSAVNLGLEHDMSRLNEALGYRTLPGQPSVSAWAAREGHKILVKKDY